MRRDLDEWGKRRNHQVLAFFSVVQIVLNLSVSKTESSVNGKNFLVNIILTRN